MTSVEGRGPLTRVVNGLRRMLVLSLYRVNLISKYLTPHELSSAPYTMPAHDFLVAIDLDGSRARLKEYDTRL